jgi:hypothetical protein
MHRKHSVRAQQQQIIARQAHQTDSTGFFNLLTGPELLSVIEDNLPAHRERLYHPTQTLAMFLSQAMNADASCQNAVNNVAIHRMLGGFSPCSARTGGYCRARQRLPTELVSTLVRTTGAMMAKQSSSAWKMQNRTIKLIDGTTVTMPDTSANQQRYPQQQGQKPGAGFPIARAVAIICLSSGAVIDAAIGAYQGERGSEHALLRPLLDTFQSGDVVLADSYYASYFLLAALQARGISFVMPQHGSRKTDFRKGLRVGTRDHVVLWQKPRQPRWMSAADYAAMPATLAIREVRAKRKTLVTSLSVHDASKHALADLYQQRWHVELDFRCIKAVLGMQQLNCKTPEMNEKEFWVYLLSYNLIRLMMAHSALLAGKLPRQLSFKHALQVWISWSCQQFRSRGRENLSLLFTLIAQRTVGNRPGRIEPRCTKRRPSAFPLLMKPRPLLQKKIRAQGHPKKLK